MFPHSKFHSQNRIHVPQQDTEICTKEKCQKMTASPRQRHLPHGITLCLKYAMSKAATYNMYHTDILLINALNSMSWWWDEGESTPVKSIQTAACVSWCRTPQPSICSVFGAGLLSSRLTSLTADAQHASADPLSNAMQRSAVDVSSVVTM